MPDLYSLSVEMRHNRGKKKPAKLLSQPLRTRTSCVRNPEIATDTDAFNVNDSQAGAGAHILRDRPSRDKSRAQARFDGGFYGLGRVQFHHDLQRASFQVLLL